MRRFGDYTDLEPPHAELVLALARSFGRWMTRPSTEISSDSRRGWPRSRPRMRWKLFSGWACWFAAASQRRAAGSSTMPIHARRGACTGRGQPVMQAVVAVETGRRNGVPLGIVSDGRRHFVACARLRSSAGIWTGTALTGELRRPGQPELPRGRIGRPGPRDPGRRAQARAALRPPDPRDCLERPAQPARPAQLETPGMPSSGMLFTAYR